MSDRIEEIHQKGFNISTPRSIPIVEGNVIPETDYAKVKVGIKATIKDYGIDEKVFLDNLDEMTEQAFDDQCTGANPRYPLMSEIKEMYLRAYYGGEQ